MTATDSTTRVDALVRSYDELDIPPKLAPQEARLLIGVWRALAEGAPVPPQRVEEIAAGAGLTAQEANEFLKWMSEKDEAGSILGTMGLTLTDWSAIRFKVDGHELRTWCALDSLFLPPILNKTAEVEVPSAVSSEPVRLSIGPERVEGLDPAGAVMSTVVPSQADRDGVQSVEEIWGIFCHHSLLFATRTEAESWAAGKDGVDLFVLAIDEAYDLAYRAFAQLRQYADRR